MALLRCFIENIGGQQEDAAVRWQSTCAERGEESGEGEQEGEEGGAAVGEGDRVAVRGGEGNEDGGGEDAEEEEEGNNGEDVDVLL